MKLFSVVFCTIFMIVILFNGCADNILKPEVHSETSPENLFNSVQGIESVLLSAYAQLAANFENKAANTLAAQEVMTDIALQSGGGIESTLNPIQNFSMAASENLLVEEMWRNPFRAIRDANVILDEINAAPIPDEEKELISAEATFIRAAAYYQLYMNYGPVPLRTSSEQELELPRASEDEMQEFLESEFTTAVSGLPEPGDEKAYGRAHKAAAIGFLTKFYLNTKQWEKSAEKAQQIIDMEIFDLYPDYFSLFFEANEGNEEMIWVRPAVATLDRDAAISLMNFIYPPNFQKHPRTGLEFCESCRNFPANWRLYDTFYNSFDSEDERRSLIVEEYVNTDGDTLSLLNNNDTRPFKYWPDQEGVGPAQGNDIPVIRYADILLSRAEALNELNGPNNESIDLINEVRNRAGISDIELSDFSSKEELRDHILQERAWEFWWEGKRRNDLIRHGKLIEKAHERGVSNAQDFHVLFPIPQEAMDANPKLEQNLGYY